MLLHPPDIFTEPSDVSPDGLANLGPLRRLAGVWQADKGVDINPKAGYLLSEPYSRFGEIVIGDALESLRRLDVAIDASSNSRCRSSGARRHSR